METNLPLTNSKDLTQLWAGLGAARDVTSFLRISLGAVMAYDDQNITPDFAHGLFQILCELDSVLGALTNTADELSVRMSSSS